MPSRTMLATGLALAVLLPAPGALADHSAIELRSVGAQVGPGGPHTAWFKWATDDGGIVVFTTSEQLAAEDLDANLDVYRRQGTSTELVSAGGAADGPEADFAGASTDGARLFFSTAEALSPDDTDLAYDLYERHGATTTLVTDRAQPGADANLEARWLGASDDGTRVFFATAEPLTADDTDAGRWDVYERHGSTTTRISVGTINDSGAAYPTFVGASADGTRVILAINQQWDPADDDGYEDIYVRSGGTTTMISDGPGTDADDHAQVRAFSTDATRILFSHSEALTADDQDSVQDLYLHDGTTLTRVTAGNAAERADFVQASPTLDRVLYGTEESVADADADGGAYDVVRATVGSDAPPELVTRGAGTGPDAIDGAVSIEAATPDLEHVLFSTDAPLAAADDDAAVYDVYRRSGSATTLLTAGPSGADDPAGWFSVVDVSDDGQRVLIESELPLLESDTDAQQDAYLLAAAGATLITPGPDAPERGPFPSALELSADGRVALVETPVAMVAEDTDGDARDIYAAVFPAHPAPAPADDPAPGDPAPGAPQPPAGPAPPATGTPVLDTRAPQVSVHRRRMTRSRLTLVVSSDEAATLRVAATMRVGKRTLRLRPVTVALAAGGARRTVKLAIPRSARGTAARLTLTLTDAAGNTARQAVRVARRR